MQMIVIFIVMFVAGIVVDLLWIGKISQGFYAKSLDSIALKNEKGNMKFRPLPAVIFYVLFVLGILIIAVIPAAGILSPESLIRSSILGAMCYGTYDLTNYATLKNFPAKLVIVDMMWGIFLTTAISAVGITFFSLL